VLRILILAAGLLMVFAGAAAVLLRILPEPHREVDYLVVGAVATFVSLIVLFVVLSKTWVKDPNLFFRRRRRK
jgi:hypothetical protein